MNDLIMRLIGLVLTVMTPELRTELLQFVANLEAQAKGTPNPWDDMFVAVLKTVLNIK